MFTRSSRCHQLFDVVVDVICHGGGGDDGVVIVVDVVVLTCSIHLAHYSFAQEFHSRG